MNLNPERSIVIKWYEIRVVPTDSTAGMPALHWETPAGDKTGAEWLAQTALKDLALSKNIEPARLASTVTPCKDC